MDAKNIALRLVSEGWMNMFKEAGPESEAASMKHVPVTEKQEQLDHEPTNSLFPLVFLLIKKRRK